MDDRFVKLKLKNKSKNTYITLNTSHIVYLRKYNLENEKDDGNLTALFTKDKMLVIDDSLDNIEKLLNNTVNI